jgi:glycosyltransferase involved in cell wall biosynthesis
MNDLPTVIYIFNRSSNYSTVVEFFRFHCRKIVFLSYEYEGDMHCDIYELGKNIHSARLKQWTYRGWIFPFAMIVNSLKLWFFLRTIASKSEQKKSICIVENWLYCPFAIVLRLLKQTSTLIYWVGDWLYLPRSNWFTTSNIRTNIQSLLFLGIDLVTYRLSTFVWNTTDRIASARKAVAPSIIDSGKEQTIYPIWIHRMSRWHHDEGDFHFVFFGAMTSGRNLEQLLYAFSKLLETDSCVYLHFVGLAINQYDQFLRTLSEKLKIETHVLFHGYNPDFGQIDKMMQSYDCGIALSELDLSHHTYYAWTSKIAYYLSMGLPVLVTRDSSILANAVVNHYAGYAVENTEKDILMGMKKIMDFHQRDFPQKMSKNINTMIQSRICLDQIRQTLFTISD